MEDIYSILDIIDFPGEKVLATIIDTKGSAYKKEGSMMAFLEDGSQVGMLSAGCFETDLSYRAAEVLKKGTIAAVQYDMRDETDYNWGQGAGCNGTITILLERVDERLKADLLKLKKMLYANIPVLGMKKIGELGEYLFLPKKGEPFGWWADEIPEEYFEVRSGMVADQPIFQHLFQPKPRLIVFGAGPDVKPLVSLASKTGFYVMVCDWRKEYCRRKNFPEADKLIVGYPSELLEKVNFLPSDFVLVISHQFQRDQEILVNLPIDKVRYVGVLGPRERTNRLLRSKDIPNGIHSPAGISISARGPEEIAISIVAELIKSWRSSVRERVGNGWASHL